MAIILAIDEDVVLTMSLDLQLGHLGHSVRRASSMAQVNQFLSDGSPDIIVIDPSIDNQAGWQIVSQKASLAPVFVTLHEPSDDIVARAKELGCAGVIPKPFMVRELVNVIMPFITPAERADAAPNPADKKEPASSKKSSSKPSKSRINTAKSESVVPARTEHTEHTEHSDTPTASEAANISLSNEDELLLAGLPSTVLMNTEVADVETLGSRLRASRNRRSIPLTQAELNTGVRLTYLQAMEEDRFSHLPRGAMAEDMITRYARYLGINVDEALSEYRSFQYGDRHDPITDYGRANLRNISYANAVRVLFAILVLGGIGYGIWYVDQPRVNALFNNARQLIMPLIATATPNSAPTPTQTETATATPTP